MADIGRNEQCHCGSGKKYKKCCLEKDQAERIAATPVGGGAGASWSESEVGDDFDAYDPERPEPERCQEWDDDDDLPDQYVIAEDLYEPYPEPPDDLPDRSPEADRLVDDWWRTAMTHYGKKLDADAMLVHLTNFMDQHPSLVAHLALNSEYLFELGAELARRREWSRYANLLLRLREHHPDAYVGGFGYFDYDLIVDQLACGRAKDVPRFFTLFHQYPTSNRDKATKVIELLAWAGMQDALFEFVKPLPPPPGAAPDEAGITISNHWLAFTQYVPFLDAHADPAIAAREIAEAMDDLLVRDGPYREDSFVEFELRRCQEPPSVGDFRACRTRTDVEDFYGSVAWNFSGFLKESRGFPWVRAHFLAMALQFYWRWRADNGRPKEPFQFDAQVMELFVCRSCRDITVIDGVRAASFLEASWHLADYLLACGLVDELERDRVHEMCSDLFRRCLPTLDATDPVPRLMPEFLTLIKGGPNVVSDVS